MAAGLQPDRAVIVEPEPDGVSALGEIEGFDRMTGCGPDPGASRFPLRHPIQRHPGAPTVTFRHHSNQFLFR